MAKKKLSMIPPKPKKAEVVPQELLDKWGAIKHIATATHCLDKGLYPHKYLTIVRESINYLAKLHETMVEDALKHPQAHMISELKNIQTEIKTAKKEAEKNGKAKQEVARAEATAKSIDPVAERTREAEVDSSDSAGSGGDAHSPKASGPEHSANP